MSPGLLQLAAVRSDRQTHAASTVSAECCGKADHKSETSRTHHTDRRRVEFKIAISPQKVLLAPSGPLRGESALSLVFTVVLVTDILLVCRAVLWCAELYCHPPRPQVADGGAASRYRG